MSFEQFPIKDELLFEFIEENKKNFYKRKEYKNGTILINFSMVRMQIPWIMSKLLFAKGIESHRGMTPIAITWNSNKKLSDFFESFGIEHIVLNEKCRKNYLGAIKAFCRTVIFLLIDGSGEGLKKMKMYGLNIGMNIYEDILRTSSLSTLRTCRNKIAIKKLFHLLLASYTLKNICRDYKVKYAITDDMAYHEGLFIKLFKKWNMKVITCSNMGEREVELDEKGEVRRHNYVSTEVIKDYIDKLTDEEIGWVDNFLEERFKGNNGREIDRQAFAGKTVLSKEELVKRFKMDPNKKTIVIMAHTFTDAVFNYGDYYFRDYYDWTEQTLKIAAENLNCNWILKPHPTRASYNESEDSIEMLFEKYKKQNMFFMSDDISSESIKNIADVLITIGGNAGAEYACFGIPAIIVGKPYYRGHGYTIEPKSFREYEEILRSAEKVNRLDDEQVNTAKKVFYYKNCPRKSEAAFTDDFAKLMNEKYKEMIDAMALSYFKSNDGTEGYNNRALSAVLKYMESNKLSDTEYFIRGLSVAKRL